MEHYMQEWVARLEWEMLGWDLGGIPDLLPENELELEHF